MNEPLQKLVGQTNWHQWKRGLFFAIGMAVAQMMMNSSMVMKADWIEIIVFIATTLGGAAFGYMQKHPIESVSSDTATFSKPSQGTKEDANSTAP